jgi:hypothetical protein
MGADELGMAEDEATEDEATEDEATEDEAAEELGRTDEEADGQVVVLGW